jgi:hypothetical protein
MNNTRRIKAFIVAMVLAGIAAAGYASFRSHAQHGYLAVAVLALAATSSRLKVKLPGINGNVGQFAVPSYRGSEPERRRSSAGHCRFHVSAMLATEERKVQPATNDLQPEHDDVCHRARKFVGAGTLARCNWIRAANTALGCFRRSSIVPGANGAGGTHCCPDRGQAVYKALERTCAAIVSLLRAQRRRDLDGSGFRQPCRLGTHTCRVPGDVRNSPLVSHVFQPNDRKYAQ